MWRSARFSRTDAMNDVQKCKRNGWKPGTRLVGDEGWGPTVIEITAIGRERILAVEISHNGEPDADGLEDDWTLELRKWRRVRQWTPMMKAADYPRNRKAIRAEIMERAKN